MTHTRTGAWPALWAFAFALLAAGAAGAEDEEFGFEIEEEAYGDEEAYERLVTPASSVELGFWWSRPDDFEFGDYTGLENEGFAVLGNVDVRLRDAFDSGRTRHLRLRGLNLGLDSRFAELEGGSQGLFGAYFLYDELPVFQTDSAFTIFDGAGGGLLTLPAGWVPGSVADAPPLSDSIDAALRELDVNHERKTFGGGGFLVLPRGFELEANHRRESRTGEKLMGAVIGFTGGNPRAVVVPEELDYVTHNYDATLRWTGEDLQLALDYRGSSFDNEKNSLIWENPFTAHPNWDPSAGHPTGRGRKGQPPDNWFHQIQASGGLSLPYHTRASLSAAFGWMTQDEPFLPFTVNPALLVPTPLPRDSLEGRIETTLVDFRVSSRPLPRLRFDLDYRYDDRDNETPRDVFIYVGGDSQDQEAIDSSRARINRPYSFERHQLSFDTGYRLFDPVQLTLGYEWEQIERDLQEVDETNEHGLHARLRGRPCDFMEAWVEYRRSWRDASRYDGTLPQLVGESPEALVGFDPATDWENHPLLRKHYLADRVRDELRGSLGFSPREDLSILLHASWALDEYDDSELGLTDAQIVSAGVDLSFTPTPRFRAHAFYGFEWLESEQAGWSFQGFAKLPQAADPGRRWWGQDEDAVHTAGLGAEFDVLPERLTLGLDTLYTQARGEVGIELGPTLAGAGPRNQSFPDAVTRLFDVSARAEYRLTDHLSLRVRYLFELFRARDWQTNDVTPTTLDNVIASGRQAPSYQAHLVGWSLVYEFW